jgi:PleD family two-component response regulator
MFAGKGPFDGRPEHPEKDRRNRPRRKMAGNRVLLLGRQRELALYRAEFLRNRGFEVKIPETSQQAIATITAGAYDVVVLSYTLSNEEVHSLAELVRQSCPECPLVTISTTGRQDLKVNPDATVLAEEGPSGLIGALSKLRGVH